MRADPGIKVEVRVDETLEAVALVLRDLKADFEESLAQISAKGTTEREGLLSQLSDLAEKVDVAIEADRRELNARLEELHQQVAASADKQREENERRAATLEAVLGVLRKKIEENEKVGRGAVDIARATQESMLRLTEESKQAVKPLAEELEGVSARHQTMWAALAELDTKILVKEDLDGLRTWVTSLSDSMAEEIAALSTQFEEFQALDQETQNLFQRIGAECKSLAAKDGEYQKKFSEALEGRAAKKDVEALQELLEETAGHVTEVLDFSQAAADSTEQALEKHRIRMETAIEALRDTFSDRQQQLRDHMAEMRARISEDILAEVQAQVDARGKDSDRMLIKQAEQFIVKLSENIKGERGPAGQVSRVQRWVADYQFPELALVRHRGGLWQALRDTMVEPGSSDNDWQLAAAGIFEMEVAPNETHPGQYRLIVRDSDDQRHEIGFHVPLPTFHKTWDAGYEYRHYDSVMEDGHRWLAVTDAPAGPPSRSEDWVLLGMRGGRGARGAKGDPGATGPAPDVEEILDAYDQRRLEADGTPVSSFRGTWRFGADYVIGDFVRGPGVVALCRQAHRAENPPTGTDARWEILFDLPDSGAEGGPRPQDLQAQITALTAQVQALTGAG